MDVRLVLPLLLVVGGTVVALAGAAPQAALTPGEAQAHPGGDVAVKGAAASVDHANRTFVLTDGTHDVLVQLGTAVPAAVVEGSSVVVKGALSLQEGRTVLDGREVLVGCPSKYSA